MNLLSVFVVLVASLSLMACTPSASNSPQTHIEGTSDSGGGNGIENRAYEAYIVKPQNLPAYRKFILPQLQKIASLTPQAQVALEMMNRWMLYKTWYIAPVSLGTISKDVIGVSFSSDRTEQLAIQTKKSIWINSTRFSRMSLQDQSILIAHEMVMTLYYLKYKPWEEVCQEKLYPQMQCDPHTIELMSEIFPSTLPRSFNTNDYENIRAVTGSMIGDAVFSSIEQVDELLSKNEFDPRFSFLSSMQSNGRPYDVVVSNNVSLAPEEVRQIFASIKYLNVTPDSCTGTKFKNETPCKMTFYEGMHPTKNFPIFNVDLVTSDSQTTTNAFFHIPYHNGTGSSFELRAYQKRVSYFLFHQAQATENAAGATFRSLVLLTLEDTSLANPVKTFLALQSVPGVVITPKSDHTADCSYAKPMATSFLNDSFLAYSKNLGTVEQRIMRFQAKSFPPYTTCVPF